MATKEKNSRIRYEPVEEEEEEVEGGLQGKEKWSRCYIWEEGQGPPVTLRSAFSRSDYGELLPVQIFT